MEMLPKLKNIPLEINAPLRAPHEDMERILSAYERRFKNLNTQKYVENYEKSLKGSDGPKRAKDILQKVDYILQIQVKALHAIGHPIEAVRDRLIEAVQFKTNHNELIPVEKPWGVNFNFRTPVYAIAILTLPSNELQDFVWTPLFNYTKDKERLYVLDVLSSAFHPEFKMAKSYKRDKFAQEWANPLQQALTRDPQNKGAALSKLMDDWVARLKRFFPLDWTPWEEQQFKYITDDGTKIFAMPNFDFAYEVALAVCAYDLDDAQFRDHPYYPRDLVDYYRANIRNTRDAWRKTGAGPSVTPEPLIVQRINLSKKKNKGFKRWLDIASHGDVDAVRGVLLKYPRVRKVKNIGGVISVMGDYGIALTADLKDDSTCESELLRLIKDREIKAQYTIPKTEYAAGSGRCEELIEHCGAWLNQQGFKLIQFDFDVDWNAIVIDQAYIDEFQELSKKFGVGIYDLTN